MRSSLHPPADGLCVLLLGFAWAAAPARAEPGAESGRVDQIRMDVSRRPLREVAAQLAQKGAVDILIPAAAGDLEVSASLVDVDVRSALQRLLADHSYMLVEHYDGRPGAHSRRVIELILFGMDTERTSAATAPAVRVVAYEDRPVDELVQTALAAAPGGERAAAIDALAYRDPQSDGPASRARSVLLSALSDPAGEVRARAIATLKDTVDQVPFDALSQVAREDERAAIRIQALELLVERAEERALEPLRVALLDRENAVRRRARELIEEWHLDIGLADEL